MCQVFCFQPEITWRSTVKSMFQRPISIPGHIKAFVHVELLIPLWTNHRVTESQNHRMVGVGRDLCGSSSPTLLPKQGHLQQAAQGCVQAGLEYLQRRRLHSLPGQPVPVLRHPQREEVLPHLQMELPVL